MTIAGGAALKIAQEINMPESVVAMNIFYMDADFTGPQAESAVLTACRLWIEDVYDTVEAIMSDELTLGSMTLYQYNSITDQWDNKGSRSPTGAGTSTTSMLPHGVCGMVRGYSVNPRSIARKYLPGMPEDRSADGAWDGTALAALAAFGVAWATEAVFDTTEKLTPSVWSVKDTTLYALSGTEVVLAHPAYQRRRRPGVGM